MLRVNVLWPPRWLLWKINRDTSSQRCCRGRQEVGRWEKNKWKAEKNSGASWVLVQIVKYLLWWYNKYSNQSVGWWNAVFPVFLPGSPPSPVPPLPERTPESFELATDEGEVTDHNPKPNLLNWNPQSLLWFIRPCLISLIFPISSCRPGGHVGARREQNPSRVVLATCCFLKQWHETFFEK